MKIRHKTAALPEKVELNMTPMIDCVFQLLAFFILTLKFVIPEGDFNIKMPSSAPEATLPTDTLVPPIAVRLTATPDGSLQGMYVNDQFLGDFASLRRKIQSLIGPQDQGPGAASTDAEVDLDCDYDLRYEYVIQAITNISGYINDDGNVVKLVERIKFKPPKPPAP